MPAYFEQGFFVREPAWHGLGVVLDDYPGRDEAMQLAGHDFTVLERPVYVSQRDEESNESGRVRVRWAHRKAEGWKALIHGTSLDVLNVVRDTYTVIQNETGWDIVDALVGAGARYETGLTLKDGAVCIVTALLDEPVTISGDDSVTLPYGVVRWAHDGSGSMACRSTSIRVVCANTDEASSMQAKRLGVDFTFRHTRKVHERIEDAKLAIRGIRAAHEEYVELAEELARTPITREQRELFVAAFLPIPPEALVSERVMANVEGARAEVRSLFNGPTIPEAHRFTAYGLRLAGIEYLDHLRGYRNSDTYVGRQLLRTEPAKAKLSKLIQEVVAA